MEWKYNFDGDFFEQTVAPVGIEDVGSFYTLRAGTALCQCFVDIGL